MGPSILNCYCFPLDIPNSYRWFMSLAHSRQRSSSPQFFRRMKSKKKVLDEVKFLLSASQKHGTECPESRFVLWCFMEYIPSNIIDIPVLRPSTQRTSQTQRVQEIRSMYIRMFSGVETISEDERTAHIATMLALIRNTTTAIRWENVNVNKSSCKSRWRPKGENIELGSFDLWTLGMRIFVQIVNR